jgi:hypothetical protein
MGKVPAARLVACGALALLWGGACTSSGPVSGGGAGGAAGQSGRPETGGAAGGVSTGGAAGRPAGLGGGGAGGSSASGPGGGGPGGGAGESPGGSAGGGGGGEAGVGGQGAGACAGLFCEDFESGRFDPAVWDVKTFGGQTAAVEDTLVAHGKYAARFHGDPNLLSYALIVTRNLPAALRGHHFGRAYVYLSPDRPTGHLSLLSAATAEVPASRKYLEVAETNEKWQLTWVDLESGGPTSASAGPNTHEAYSIGDAASPDSPVGRWVCVEWEFNDTPDEVRVFVDGAQAWSYAPISYQGASSGLVGGFSNVSFGYYIWHPGPAAFDVYYDDIVLDTRRVGCLP